MTATPTVGVLNLPSSNGVFTDPNGVQFVANPVADPTAMADALGLALGLNIAGGASIATATVKPTAQVSVGAGTNLTAGGDVILLADQNRNADGTANPQAVKAHAVAAAGSLRLAGAGADATAEDSPTVTVTVGGVPNVATGKPAAPVAIAAGGNVILNAESQTDAEVTSTGLGVGLIAGIGVTLGTATVNATTTALFQNGTAQAGGDFDVRAAGNDTTTAHTQAVAGGILAGLGTVATGNLNDAATAVVAGASTVHALNDINVKAADLTYGSADARGIDAGVLAVGVAQGKQTTSPVVAATVAGIADRRPGHRRRGRAELRRGREPGQQPGDAGPGRTPPATAASRWRSTKPPPTAR